MIVIQEGFSSIHVEEMLKSIRPLLPKYFMVLEAMEAGNQPPQRMITEMDARLPADKKGIARYFVLTQGWTGQCVYYPKYSIEGTGNQRRRL